MKIVTLVSGGIDSFVMTNMLQKNGHDVLPLFINYGQLSIDREYSSYLKVCNYLGLVPVLIDISNFGSFVKSGITNKNLNVVDEAFLPNRNLLFLTLAASYAFQNDIYNVAIGIIENPIFSDQTLKFLDAAETCVKESLEVDLKLLFPLKELNKLDIYKLAYKHRIPLDIIYYCHVGDSEPCNNCLACKEHVIAQEQIKKILESGNVDWE